MKYDARHTEPDLYIARKVHKGLEILKVPETLKVPGECSPKIGKKENRACVPGSGGASHGESPGKRFPAEKSISARAGTAIDQWKGRKK